MRRISPLAVLLAVFSAVLIAPSVAAIDTGSQHIALTPSSAELSIAPGQSGSGSVAVINQGNDGFSVRTSVLPYHVKGIDYDPQFTQLPGTVDASKWVQLHVEEPPTLTPGKLLHVDYTVTVPAGTQPGGYYAVIFAESTPTKVSGGVVAHNRVGEILYLTVEGAVRTSGSVAAGNLTHFTTNGNVAISTLVRNTGGVHFKSTVTVTAKNIFGTQVFKQSEQRYILPQTERNVNITWANHVPIGIYHISRQATVPSGTVTLPNQLVVMVQPWVVVLVIIIVLLLIATLVRNLRGNRKKA